MTNDELLVEAMLVIVRSEVLKVPMDTVKTGFFISLFDTPDVLRAEYWIDDGVVYKDSEEVYRLD